MCLHSPVLRCRHELADLPDAHVHLEGQDDEKRAGDARDPHKLEAALRRHRQASKLK